MKPNISKLLVCLLGCLVPVKETLGEVGFRPVLTETHAERTSARFQSQTVWKPDERESLLDPTYRALHWKGSSCGEK